MYLIHTPSDVRELEGLDISFELFPFSEDRIWPMIVEFQSDSDIAEALKYGLVTTHQ